MNRDVDVIVREVGPRDGLQLVKTVLPTETKLAWIKAEKEAGMVEFEVCSFVPPKVIPQFADARAVAGGALEIPGIRVMAQRGTGSPAGLNQVGNSLSAAEQLR